MTQGHFQLPTTVVGRTSSVLLGVPISDLSDAYLIREERGLSDRLTYGHHRFGQWYTMIDAFRACELRMEMSLLLPAAVAEANWGRAEQGKALFTIADFRDSYARPDSVYEYAKWRRQSIARLDEIRRQRRELQQRMEDDRRQLVAVRAERISRGLQVNRGTWP